MHVEALGHLAIGDVPVTRDSIFRIASTTKPITAAATLARIDEGLLELDEPVDELLPELTERRVLRRMDGPLEETVPAVRSITTRDLLTFTFGFGMATAIFTSEATWPVVKAAQDLKLATLAGASVAGVLAARAAGEPRRPIAWPRPTVPRPTVSSSGTSRMELGAVRPPSAMEPPAWSRLPSGLGPNFFTGRSWALGQSVLDSGAFGWDGGLGTTWQVDPAHELTIIVLTQRAFETSEPPQVHRGIQAAAYGALGAGTA